MSIKISELIKLIEACGHAGVKKLVHETETGLPINLEFFETKSAQEVPVVKILTKDSEVTLPQVTGMEVSPTFEKVEQLRILEDDFDLLPIQDPERFEELLANGKLEHYGEAHAN